VLLASRMDARHDIDRGPVDLVGLVAEEASRVGAEVDIEDVGFPLQPYSGDDRLLRRAARNLLENAVAMVARTSGCSSRMARAHQPEGE
jgi:signal transduction histidine kinase